MIERSADALSDTVVNKLKQIYQTFASGCLAMRSPGGAGSGGAGRGSTARRRTLEAVLAERIADDPNFADVLAIADEAAAGGISVTAIDPGIVAGDDVIQRDII